MQYLATIKKKSPMHNLWRKNAPAHIAHKVRFLDTLFTFNKATGEYQAQGELVNLGRLMRHPHVHVVTLTEPVGEVTIKQPAPQAPEDEEPAPEDE